MKKVLVVRRNGQVIEAAAGWDQHHRDLQHIGSSVALDKTQSLQYLVVQKKDELLIHQESRDNSSKKVKHLVRLPKSTNGR